MRSRSRGLSFHSCFTCGGGARICGTHDNTFRFYHVERSRPRKLLPLPEQTKILYYQTEPVGRIIGAWQLFGGNYCTYIDFVRAACKKENQKKQDEEPLSFSGGPVSGLNI